MDKEATSKVEEINNGKRIIPTFIINEISYTNPDNIVLSSVLGNTNQLDESTPFSINQNVNNYYTLNDKNIFAFEAQHLL
ncbi:MAG: hypothetical protein QNK20_05215 [Aureibaculum sp.]|nr:hypothetical protein [Aureibaculum sp.]